MSSLRDFVFNNVHSFYFINISWPFQEISSITKSLEKRQGNFSTHSGQKNFLHDYFEELLRQMELFLAKNGRKRNN